MWLVDVGDCDCDLLQTDIMGVCLARPGQPRVCCYCGCSYVIVVVVVVVYLLLLLLWKGIAKLRYSCKEGFVTGTTTGECDCGCFMLVIEVCHCGQTLRLTADFACVCV